MTPINNSEDYQSACQPGAGMLIEPHVELVSLYWEPMQFDFQPPTDPGNESSTRLVLDTILGYFAGVTLLPADKVQQEHVLNLKVIAARAP